MVQFSTDYGHSYTIFRNGIFGKESERLNKSDNIVAKTISVISKLILPKVKVRIVENSAILIFFLGIREERNKYALQSHRQS